MNEFPHPADLMALPCGGIAYYDYENEISYRCGQCDAVVGSIGILTLLDIQMKDGGL